MIFNKESEFEEAVIKKLIEHGWESEVLKYPTEDDLLQNWADILFENNRSIDRLNDYPLTPSEMQQIIEQINVLKTPLKLNGFINGKSVSIKRDNPDDQLHFGKEISLKIYDRQEIAQGDSRYQIVQQPKFPTKSRILNDRRGDLMLLINGMPVIHIELKRSGVEISEAYRQIEKYSHEGIFTGLFSLVQIFVAMQPTETVYFANPGPQGSFNPLFYFHWADFNNEIINDWDKVVSTLLSIPMAHQLIGFYTVADDSDGILKVMRSYQYFAASAISDKVSKHKWNSCDQLGGYIWHTTGSGKTMTSFKSAQLIANSKDADKVVFLMDRIELGTQSLKEYRNFAEDSEDVQATENSQVLLSKLKSSDPADTLIVTSIQKMSNIKEEDGGFNARDIDIINDKRLVFIIDECHRSTFGEMLSTIKQTFPKALFFGFTGTPIHNENQVNMNTTSTVFGDELHRYSIADGIRDKNVLPFDLHRVTTFDDDVLREAVALDKAKAKNVDEATTNAKKKEVFDFYMDKINVRMAGFVDESGKYIEGIEDYVPNSQYETEKHTSMVVGHILSHWETLSRARKFHGIFATSSIDDAIKYYRLFKSEIAKLNLNLNVTALFDPTIGNNDRSLFKEDGLAEIIQDYNETFGQEFSIPSFQSMKKDIAARLAHKKPYIRIDKDSGNQIDLLIVVDQMLTGFDSKWINCLYLDKLLSYQNVIQAFSRTNRLFGNDKPFGTIKYFRKTNTMERDVNEAVKLYSGDKPFGLFVDHLNENIKKLNSIFEEIKSIFASCKIDNFEILPPDIASRKKFVKEFNSFNRYLEAAKIQGFVWEQQVYSDEVDDEIVSQVEVAFTKNDYDSLVQRYKELTKERIGGGTDVPYDIDSNITDINTGLIDSEYMNSRFDKYMKLVHSDRVTKDEIEQAESELHKSFATLNQEEQKFANILLHDIQRGDVDLPDDCTFMDYIYRYMENAKRDQIGKFADVFELDEGLLRELMSLSIDENNIDEFGRFSRLKDSVNRQKVRAFLEDKTGKQLTLPQVSIKTDEILRSFIISGGIDIEDIRL